MKKKHSNWRIENCEQSLKAVEFWFSRYKREMGGITKCNPLEVARYKSQISETKTRLKDLMAN